MLCCFLLILSTLQVSGASGDWLHDELSSIHQEIDLLRRENQNQNIQIAFLKEKAGLQDEPDHLFRQVPTDIPENVKAAMMKISSQLIAKGSHHRRQERPARLLPLQVLFRRNNNTENKISRFYGEPTNCSQLSELGYTLNGFYLIKSSSPLDTSGLQLETVFCSFKQHEGRPFNSSALEKRVGFLKLDGKAWETDDVDKEFPTNPSSITHNNTRNNSSGRIMFHLQIRNSSNNIVQITGSALNFDLILSNFENCYSPNDRAFLVPIDGWYKFVFEGKILSKNVRNITFRYSARYRPPDYKTGSTLESAQASDMTNNTVKLVTIQRLTKSSKAQLKTNSNSKGTFILSADNFTSFKAYLMP